MSHFLVKLQEVSAALASFPLRREMKEAVNP
jgi:hypothetical protein